jgi:cytochrome-b5 reductase
MMSLITRLTKRKNIVIPIAIGSAAIAATLTFSTYEPLSKKTSVAFKGDDQWVDLKVSTLFRKFN